MTTAAEAKAIVSLLSGKKGRQAYPVDVKREGHHYTLTGVDSRVCFTLANPVDDYAVKPQNPGDVDGSKWDFVEWQPLGTWPAETLAYIAQAMATKDVRYYLNGMAFYAHGVAATDGHRLHYCGTVESEATAILPRDAVALALRLQKKGKVTISTGEGSFRIDVAGGVEIYGLLIDAKYPDIPRVIPKTAAGYTPIQVAEHSRAEISKARDIVKTASPKYRGAALFEHAYSNAGDRLPLNISLPSGCEFGINGDYLADALKPNAPATLHYLDASSSILIQSGGLSAVIMPMRLDIKNNIRAAVAEKQAASQAQEATPTTVIEFPAAPIAATHAAEDRPRMAAMTARSQDSVRVEHIPQPVAPAPVRDVSGFTVGDLVRVSSGTAKPPAHHKQKVKDWNARNYEARVSCIEGGRVGVQIGGRTFMTYMLDPATNIIEIITKAAPVESQQPSAPEALPPCPPEAPEQEECSQEPSESQPEQPSTLVHNGYVIYPYSVGSSQKWCVANPGHNYSSERKGATVGGSIASKEKAILFAESLPALDSVAETSAPQQPAEPSQLQPVPASLIQWPEGITVSDKLSRPAQVAAIIRKTLAAIGIPCRAKSDSYSMGDSVRVALEDVPPAYLEEIRAHFSRHEQGSFNGMEDIYEYSNSRGDIPQTKYLFIECSYTAPIEAAAWQWFADNFSPEGLDDVPQDITSREFQSARIWNNYAPAVLWRVLTGALDLSGRTFWDDYPGGWRPIGGKAPTVPATPTQGTGAHVEQHHNTRKGFDYWLVVLANRVDRDAFGALLAQAKAAGGWYARQWGDIPGGLAFKAQAAAEAFAAELSGGPSGTPGGGKPSAPQPVRPTSAPSPVPAATSAKLRTLAEKLQPAIDSAFSPRLDNTPKRAAQAAHARLEGHRLERTQKALRVLADMAEAGATPPELAGITTKKAVYDLMGSTTENVANGWHSYRVDTGKPATDSEAARLLWAMIENNSERHQQAELAAKLAAAKLAGIPGYFPTPEAVAREILQHIDLYPGCTVLEPSAGSGSLCDVVRQIEPEATITALEINPTLAAVLQSRGIPTETADFMEYAGPLLADFVVMNPPFEGMQDADHVRRAFCFLKPGGRMVAIMAPSAFNSSTSKAREFREWFAAIGGERLDLPAGSFKESGTGVSTCYVVIDKPRPEAVKEPFASAETSHPQPVQEREPSETQPVPAPQYEALDRQGLAYWRAARTLGELPREEMEAAKAALWPALCAIIDIPAAASVAALRYGLSVWEHFAITRGQAGRHPQSELLLIRVCDLPLSLLGQEQAALPLAPTNATLH